MNKNLLKIYVTELIKNEDFISFEEFMEELQKDREAVIEYLKLRVNGFVGYHEYITTNYVNTCKMILEMI